MLPQGISGLVSLQSLNVEDCCLLVSLPDGISSLVSLQALCICHTPVTRLPDSLGNLTRLTLLEAFGCWRLTSLPASLTQLLNLKVLTLNGCAELTALPDGLTSLSKLRKLDLRQCYNISDHPDRTSMPSLTKVHAYGKALLPCSDCLSVPRKLSMVDNITTCTSLLVHCISIFRC